MFTDPFVILIFLFWIFVLIYITRITLPKFYDLLYIPAIEKIFSKVDELFIKEYPIDELIEKKTIEKNIIVPEEKNVIVSEEKNSQSLSNKEKGNEFEKFIVGKLDKRYFRCRSWSSDKSSNGRFSLRDLNPDLFLDYRAKQEHKPFKFAIECKYRSSYYDEKISLDESQLKRYKRYASIKRRKVYLAIGVGGNPYSPNEVFIVPLNEVKNNELKKSFLNQYKRVDPNKKLFFNIKNYTLN